jgi:hypothetical protein
LTHINDHQWKCKIEDYKEYNFYHSRMIIADQI